MYDTSEWDIGHGDDYGTCAACLAAGDNEELICAGISMQGQEGKKEMGDSLDDLDFPHIANQLLESIRIERRRLKPQALGVVKRWRYIFHMEDGLQLCVGNEYVGTEPEAMWEGENRLCEHERGGGETPVSIEVQSQGKPNDKAQISSEVG